METRMILPDHVLKREEIILAIDPGTHETAWVVWDGLSVWRTGFEKNESFLDKLRHGFANYTTIAVEMIASYGMAVGKEVFETCKLIGRIEEIAERKAARCEMIYRKDVKMHICQSMRAKDANIRQALIDRLGPQGTKKQPGATYGIKSHLWAALAVAVYTHDTLSEGREG